jgi:hypothetical protein
MTDLVVAYAPWRLTYHLLEDSVRHPWIGTYVPHPIRSQWWQYIDVDPALRAGGLTTKGDGRGAKDAGRATPGDG